jgi:hypothetical protein
VRVCPDESVIVTTVRVVGEGDDGGDDGGDDSDDDGDDEEVSEEAVGAGVDDAVFDGGGVAEGINDANEGGNIVCPDITTAHIPAKTIVSKLIQ